MKTLLQTITYLLYSRAEGSKISFRYVECDPNGDVLYEGTDWTMGNGFLYLGQHQVGLHKEVFASFIGTENVINLVNCPLEIEVQEVKNRDDLSSFFYSCG